MPKVCQEKGQVCPWLIAEANAMNTIPRCRFVLLIGTLLGQCVFSTLTHCPELWYQLSVNFAWDGSIFMALSDC